MFLLRLVLAAVFTYAAIVLVGVSVSSGLLEDSPILGVLAIAAIVAAALFLAMILFNRWDTVADMLLPAARSRELLLRKGVLTQKNYQARRAFKVGEANTEGPHYFVELMGGEVIYLSGQYLYSYEPHETEEDEPAAARRFPATEFSVLRNERDKHVRELECIGDVMEPECEFAFPEDSWPEAIFKKNPEDGAIVPGANYERLKTVLGREGS